MKKIIAVIAVLLYLFWEFILHYLWLWSAYIVGMVALTGLIHLLAPPIHWEALTFTYITVFIICVIAAVIDSYTGKKIRT